MGWSTSEIARLAGITLRTVRHYHDIELLDEPERTSNGYKSYRTQHLVRLLEIRRLVRLGLSLSAIAAVLRNSDDFEETLRAVQSDLAENIARLQRAMEEVAQLQHHPVATDLPFEVSAAADSVDLSVTDRSLYAVITQVGGERGLDHWSEMIKATQRSPASREFDSLPSDADEQTRHRLAQQLIPETADLLANHPLPPSALPPAFGDQLAYSRAVIDALADLYNPAQLDVMTRIWRGVGAI